jgi:hypothetical protein
MHTEFCDTIFREISHQKLIAYFAKISFLFCKIRSKFRNGLSWNIAKFNGKFQKIFANVIKKKYYFTRRSDKNEFCANFLVYSSSKHWISKGCWSAYPLTNLPKLLRIQFKINYIHNFLLSLLILYSNYL